ncbi:sensor domain CHASE2-containing protein [Ekhidna lutea]|uniref:Sensor domain CHASE2-containing protein n=1 Tax=Ekhidna lutea TaxID=447679 RepID=A0A239HRK9_EKHLU|nr:CHASE2 domain-containing protein [Ekhidna lutea]SNS84007.1 sensor domain CHASE2-containing protein [Ekhidna lutea]
MKYKIWHAANATILSLLVAFFTLDVVSYVPYLDSFVDPVLDWDFTDHYYDDFDDSKVPIDTSLVIVNIGYLDRAGIADLITKVNKEEPLAIGLHLFFNERRDSLQDKKLKNAIDNTGDLIMIKGYNSSTNASRDSHPYFTENAIITYSDIQDDKLGIMRSFRPKIKIADNDYWHIAVEMASLINPSSKNTISERNKEIEFIKFHGREFNFSILDHDITDFSSVKNKVVLLGFLGGPSIYDYSFEDNFFTPLKFEIMGNRIPDMYATTIIANSVKMIIEEDFIDYSQHLDIYGSLILCFLITLGYAYLHNHTKHNLLLARFISLGLIVLLIYSTLTLFTYYNFKFDISAVILFLLIGSDMYEFYFRYYQQSLDGYSIRSMRVAFLSFIGLVGIIILAVFFGWHMMFSLLSFAFVIYFVSLKIWLHLNAPTDS